MIIVGETENAKQIHLSVPERESLVNSLEETGESIQEITRMGKAVSSNQDYGRISFDLWLVQTVTYTYQEAVNIYKETIERLRRKAKRAGWTDDHMAREGLIGEQEDYYRRYEEALQQKKAELKVRIRKVKSFLKSCDESIREEVLLLALEKKVMIKDDLWQMILPDCASVFLLKEVEAIMRRL